MAETWRMIRSPRRRRDPLQHLVLGHPELLAERGVGPLDNRKLVLDQIAQPGVLRIHPAPKDTLAAMRAAPTRRRRSCRLTAGCGGAAEHDRQVIFEQNCAACHSIAAGKPSPVAKAPNLYDLHPSATEVRRAVTEGAPGCRETWSRATRWARSSSTSRRRPPGDACPPGFDAAARAGGGDGPRPHHPRRLARVPAAAGGGGAGGAGGGGRADRRHRPDVRVGPAVRAASSAYGRR